MAPEVSPLEMLQAALLPHLERKNISVGFTPGLMVRLPHECSEQVSRHISEEPRREGPLRLDL